MSLSPSDRAEHDQVLAKLHARPRFEQDFTTPEGAILCLEDAYRRRNLESAIACKDFLIEGTVMLLNYDPAMARDPEVRKKNAVLAERAFRQKILESWPELQGVESYFFGRQDYADGIVAVMEVRRMPDGTFDKLNVLAAKTRNGWRVLNEVSDDEIDE